MRQINSPRNYLIVNAILSGVILLIWGYSLIFSPDKNDYPVVCIHEKITGQQCASCGMSHAFSFIIRGQIEKAEAWNKYALQLFVFLFVQLLMRAGISSWLLSDGPKPVMVGYFDAIISAIMALYVFFPFLKAEWILLVA